MPAVPLLSFQNLTYAYAAPVERALKGLAAGKEHHGNTEVDAHALAVGPVSGTLHEGTTWVIMGASGSGKSTLLKLLAGHLQPTEGHILFRGQPLPGPETQLVPGHPDIALLDQLPVFQPRLSCQQVLVHALRGYERHWAQAEAMRLLEAVGLADKHDRHPGTLSGGEQQRLAIVVAMSTRPALCLLDEPLSRVDAHLKQTLLSTLQQLATDYGITMVWTLHEPYLAMGIAQQLSFMHHGTWLQQGSAETLYAHPINGTAAALLGHASPNPGLFKTAGQWLRPQDLTLLPDAQADAIPMTVQESLYQGAYWLVHGTTTTGEVLTVQHYRSVEVGSRVYVALRAGLGK